MNKRSNDVSIVKGVPLAIYMVNSEKINSEKISIMMDAQSENLFKRPKEITQLLIFCIAIGVFLLAIILLLFILYNEIPTDMLLASLIPLFIFLFLPSYQLFINIPCYIIINENHIAFIHYFFSVDIKRSDIIDIRLIRTKNKGTILVINHVNGVKKLSSNQWRNFFSPDNSFDEIISRLKKCGYYIIE